MCQRSMSDDEVLVHRAMRLVAETNGYESELIELGCRCHLPRRPAQPLPPLPATVPWNGDYDPLD